MSDWGWFRLGFGVVLLAEIIILVVLVLSAEATPPAVPVTVCHDGTTVHMRIVVPPGKRWGTDWAYFGGHIPDHPSDYLGECVR